MATLYRHHRPQTFSDLVGQDHIRRTLQAALASGRLGHAYLFAGPRGTGKTTVARLLAKAINCLGRIPDTRYRIPDTRYQIPDTGYRIPDTNSAKKSEIRNPKSEIRDLNPEPCNQCQQCQDITDGRSLDVIEVDAASNRGIDEIRELRDKVRFAPTSARAKVYIIDEVHMLTKEAFNALLKTLEEPPAHVTFVLATTESHKVPVTISSRCQVFVFKKASPADLVSRLTVVAEREQLRIEPAALDFLARLAGGSYRDALSLLDQVQGVSDGPITRAAIHDLLGIPTAERVGAILLAIRTAPADAALALLGQAEAEGVDLDHLTSQLIEAARALLHAHHGVALDVPAAEARNWDELRVAWPPSDLVALITDLAAAKAAMKHASIPLLPLELVVLRFSQQTESQNQESRIKNQESKPKVKSEDSSGPETAQEQAAIADEPSKQEVTPPAGGGSRSGGTRSENDDEQPQRVMKKNIPAPEPEKRDAKAEGVSPIPASADFWPAVLDKVREQNMSLYGLLLTAEFVGIADGALKLQVPFAFARDRLMDRKHRERLLGIADALADATLTLDCEICPREHVVHHPEDEHDPSTLAAVIDVFEIEEAPSSS